MTSRSEVLNELEPEPTVSLNPEDIKELNINASSRVSIISRRGRLDANLRIDPNVQKKYNFYGFLFCGFSCKSNN